MDKVHPPNDGHGFFGMGLDPDKSDTPTDTADAVAGRPPKRLSPDVAVALLVGFLFGWALTYVVYRGAIDRLHVDQEQLQRVEDRNDYLETLVLKYNRTWSNIVRDGMTPTPQQEENRQKIFRLLDEIHDGQVRTPKHKE